MSCVATQVGPYAVPETNGRIERHQYVVVGAGPAGLQVAYYLERAGRDYLVLEAGMSPGTFFQTFPRHRRLISINKVHTGHEDAERNLRWDWNSLLSEPGGPLFKDYSGAYFPVAADLLRYLQDYAARFRLRVRYDARVERVRRQDGAFRLTTADREYRCDTVVMAGGTPQPYVPAIEGIEQAEQYASVSVDADDFANQRVLIVGKGNSAFETADNLVASAALMHLVSPHSVKQAWKTHYPGSLRAVNNNILETYRLKGQNALLDATLDRVRPLPDGRFMATVSYSHANGEREDLCYDRVICCTGFRTDLSMFDGDCAPERTIYGRLPAMTSGWESTNVPGLYFAGSVTQVRDYRQSASPFIHGFRYNARALCRMLALRDHGERWPRREVPATPAAMGDAILERVNRSSALWQQFGYLCDVLAVGQDAGCARYHEELPVDFVAGSGFSGGEHYYTVTLEYGHEEEHVDPFDSVRVRRDDVARAPGSKFLHPIVRRFSAGRLLAEHHVIEDLETEWWAPEHVQPLRAFLERQLSA